jgi:hypothetical protein
MKNKHNSRQFNVMNVWNLNSLTHSLLDELDTQTPLSPEKSLYLQCFANENF